MIELSGTLATQAFTVVANILLFIGVLTFAGSVIFDVFIARASIPSSRRVAVTAGILASISALLLLPLRAMWMLELDPTALFRPDAWLPLVLRPSIAIAVITCLGVTATLLLLQATSAARPAAATIALAVAVAPVLVGHSAVLTPVILRGAVAVHLGAGGVWVGGIVGLLTHLTARDGPVADPVARTAMVQRLSNWALGSVIAIALTGTAVATVQVGSLDALIGTQYGRLLTLKVSLVGVIVLIAAYNRFRVLPALRRHASDPPAWSALRRLVAYEAGMLLAIMIVTGILTNTSPSH